MFIVKTLNFHYGYWTLDRFDNPILATEEQIALIKPPSTLKQEIRDHVAGCVHGYKNWAEEEKGMFTSDTQFTTTVNDDREIKLEIQYTRDHDFDDLTVDFILDEIVETTWDVGKVGDKPVFVRLMC